MKREKDEEAYKDAFKTGESREKQAGEELLCDIAELWHNIEAEQPISPAKKC